MSKAKSKLAAAAIPQDHAQVNDAIFRIGDYDRQIGLLDIGLKDALAKVKETFEKQSQPIEHLREMEISGVMTWCEAHRRDLTQDGKTKTAKFPAGQVSWRSRPPKCSLPKDASKIIDWLTNNRGGDYLRVLVEVSKEALLANVAFAKTVPGVKIGSEGEDIIIEPFSPKGLEAAS
jgi:phage host-nuclease inhibitor protein Gam